jgi:hypothetical protein
MDRFSVRFACTAAVLAGVALVQAPAGAVSIQMGSQLQFSGALKVDAQTILFSPDSAVGGYDSIFDSDGALYTIVSANNTGSFAGFNTPPYFNIPGEIQSIVRNPISPVERFLWIPPSDSRDGLATVASVPELSFTLLSLAVETGSTHPTFTLSGKGKLYDASENFLSDATVLLTSQSTSFDSDGGITGSYSATLTAVPEPAPLAGLAGLGLCFGALAHRRRAGQAGN